MNDKIRRTHIERRAVVYLRQSTLKQVYENRESTLRQYNLEQRARELGWAHDSVQVVDEDLGQSGTSVERRDGFQRLAEDVAQGRVGAIFALEASRLARSSVDWHKLLELCRLADVLIADENGVYAPRDPNDRLLLGLKGQMSEAELYWMRLRLQGGRLNKARRGALYFSPPTGYCWDESTQRFVFDPDEEVRRVVALVFERFRIEGSARGVSRYFAQKRLRLPARNSSGELNWVPVDYTGINNILKNPVYAGAYVYGRREERKALINGEVKHRLTRLSREDWAVCLPEQHEGYITWEQYLQNQEKLNQNRTNHVQPDQRGAAREGTALLQGLALCGLCGSRMTVGYIGRDGHLPQYVCGLRGPNRALRRPCWTVSGRAIDEAVAELFLKVAQPPELELSLAVSVEAERQAFELQRQWRLRLERVHYEAKLAERRYKAVDPDNRVVARTLERDWEEKLIEVERTEREYEEVRRREKVVLTQADRTRILELARDLPRVFRSPSTSQAQRKTLLRMLIGEVTLTPVDVPKRMTRLQVLWVTGAVSELLIDRPDSARARATPLVAEERIRELTEQGVTTREIVDDLNRRGLKTGTGLPWNLKRVMRVRRNRGFRRPASAIPEAAPRADGLLTVKDIAAKFGVTRATVCYWILLGQLRPITPGGKGVLRLFKLDDLTVARLQKIKARGYGPRAQRFH